MLFKKFERLDEIEQSIDMFNLSTVRKFRGANIYKILSANLQPLNLLKVKAKKGSISLIIGIVYPGYERG